MLKKDFYNNLFASGQHRNWREAPGKLVVLGYALDHIQEKATLLDVGCGDGYFVDRVLDEAEAKNIRNVSANGVDISSEAVGLAAAAYLRPTFSVMDAECLTFSSASFDAIVSYGVFEHLSNPAAALREVSRVLREGGWFAMMMPTIGFYRKDRLDEGWYEDLNDPPQMQWNYTREKWEAFFHSAGLKLEHMNYSVNYGAINPGNFYFGHKV